jgi:hypothetical protein
MATLEKPFAPDQLASCVKSCLQREPLTFREIIGITAPRAPRSADRGRWRG